jgi:hypothetical protein
MMSMQPVMLINIMNYLFYCFKVWLYVKAFYFLFDYIDKKLIHLIVK